MQLYVELNMSPLFQCSLVYEGQFLNLKKGQCFLPECSRCLTKQQIEWHQKEANALLHQNLRANAN